MSSRSPFQPTRADDVSVATILPVLERLRAAVEAENQEIAARGRVDYRAHTQRKNQGLFELAKLKGLIERARHHPVIAAAFADLAGKLDVNRRLLAAQLRAARTVADIVSRAIRENQSDGTYSAYPWRDDLT
jgi:hypothetical protein